MQALDFELSAQGGAARFIMDDGYAVGPPELVFEAVRRFGEAIAPLGLELQEGKSECYCPAGPETISAHRPITFPLGTCRDRAGMALQPIGHGIQVGGVPLSDTALVQHFLAHKVSKVVSKIDKVNNMLRPLHFQAIVTHGLNTQATVHFQTMD